MFFGTLRIEEMLPRKKGGKSGASFHHFKVEKDFFLLFIARSKMDRYGKV